MYCTALHCKLFAMIILSVGGKFLVTILLVKILDPADIFHPKQKDFILSRKKRT